MDCMILSVMYIWCQLNKETIMSFWFGMQFKAMYMPWVILVFNWIMSGSYVEFSLVLFFLIGMFI
jgi:derlin-1